MEALKVLAWLFGLIISIGGVYALVGIHSMINFFPEGRRWWMVPAQWVSLAFFALMVLLNPWS